jgi:hypothetical protein
MRVGAYEIYHEKKDAYKSEFSIDNILKFGDHKKITLINRVFEESNEANYRDSSFCDTRASFESGFSSFAVT